MSKFTEILDGLEKVNVAYSKTSKTMQADFEAECVSAWKAKFPRRKFSMPRSYKDNQPVHGEIYGRWEAKCKAVIEQHTADVDRFVAEIKAAAKDEPLPAFEGMSLYQTVNSGNYRSQGFGEHKYARADAEDRADKARAYGLEVHIREVETASGRDVCGWPYRVVDYEIWVSTDEVGVKILEHKPDKETMADWIQKCDKRGVNPRVMFPLMTYEQEENIRKAGTK